MLTADDVTWTVSGHNSWSGGFHGKDSVRRDLLGPLGAQFEGRARYDNKYCFVFRLADGRIREITEYMDTQLVAEVLTELAR